MKKRNCILFSLLSLLMISCDKDVEMVINVQLNPTILTLTDGGNEPMKVKSMAPSSDDPVLCYAIQIYENDIPYYYGLFNDISKMVIALSTDKTYTFKVAAYKTGTGKGLKTVTDTAGLNYFLPDKVALKNKFISGDVLKLIDLSNSAITVGQQKEYNEIDVFYSTKSVMIEKGTSSIDFNMLRMGFGINFNVDGLTNGFLEIYMGNDTLKLNNSLTTASTIRQYAKTVQFESIYTKADSYGDSISVSAKWTGTNGAVVTASGKYKFLRNYQKTISIHLNTTNSNLNFEGWIIPKSTICSTIGQDSALLYNNGYIVGDHSNSITSPIHTESKWVKITGADSLKLETMQHRLYDSSKIYNQNGTLIWNWNGESLSFSTYNLRRAC